MYAVIEKTTRAVLRTCNTKEAALVACQLEKDKVGVAERCNITAVTMDDGGYSEILFLCRFSTIGFQDRFPFRSRSFFVCPHFKIPGSAPKRIAFVMDEPGVM